MTEVFGKGPDCWPIEEIRRAMDLPAGSADREAIERHVDSCAWCQTEMAMLREFESGAIRDDEREAVEWIAGRLSAPQVKARVVEMPRRSHWSGKRITAILAVAAALIVAINLAWYREAGMPADGPDVLRSASVKVLAPVGEFAAAPVEFRWAPVPGAARYHLVVSEVDRTVVFETTITGTSVPLPVRVRDLLRPGKTLQWSVSAQDGGGRELASSGTQRFSTKL